MGGGRAGLRRAVFGERIRSASGSFVMMAILTVFQVGLIVAVVGYLVVNMLDIIKVEPATGRLPQSPSVSVCVPARNEARDIEACLTSLLQQDYPDFEVIVVDDNSTDATPEILRALQRKFPDLVILKGEPLAEGWYGKPFALHQAARAVRGELLLFTDADPVFEPHALTSAVHLMNNKNLDLLTLMPAARFGSFWEKTVQPLFFAMIVGLTRFSKVNDPKDPAAMGIGAFLMIRRKIYDRIGGHEGLRQAILEDIGMARLAKQAGAKIMIADAKKLFSIRMYHSLNEIWTGWRKNVFLAFKKSVVKTLYYVGVILGFTLTPWVLVGVHAAIGSGWILQLLSVAGLVLVLITEMTLCEELQLEKRCAFLFPLGAVILSAILINSMWQILFRGRSEWRGRTYIQPKN